MSDHKHLKRLTRVWKRDAVYFITTCVTERRAVLANETVHRILKQELSTMNSRHGWAIGRYTIMPDHVHFFAKPVGAEAKKLSQAIGRWKEWTAKQILNSRRLEAPLWQPEFFDHVLRSNESRVQKWHYMRENPVRAGLVSDAEAWPYTGRIDFD